jgi:hypothetical protein
MTFSHVAENGEIVGTVAQTASVLILERRTFK